MANTNTTIERLEELLAVKDAELAKLQAQLDEIAERSTWKWTLPTMRDADPYDLPLPRLEIACTPCFANRWDATEWRYCLVYQHLLGHIVWSPLGETRCTGGRHDMPPPFDDLPIRDGAHIRHDAKTLRLPAFVVINGKTSPLRERTAEVADG